MKGKIASALIDYDDLDGTYARLRRLEARPVHKAARAITILGVAALGFAVYSASSYAWGQLELIREVSAQSGSRAVIEILNLAGLVPLLASASLVWGIGLALDMLDRQVWLAAGDEDRLAIYCRRHTITPREGLTEFASEVESKNA